MMAMTRWPLLLGTLGVLLLGTGLSAENSITAPRMEPPEGPMSDTHWVREIEQVFPRSENCRQCHDRQDGEWTVGRERAIRSNAPPRVDLTFPHGTAITTPLFQHVFGLWLQTQPTGDQRTRCLSCHVPSITAFPQHTDKIARQVLSGTVTVEGISCATCHAVDHVHAENGSSPPTFSLKPGKAFFGPFPSPEENLVHPAQQSDLYRGAHYCAACHFDKVKDVTRPDLPGEILQGTVCQDCHMEQSTGSATSKRGAMTRPIGRHEFHGVIVPALMLKNRNLQAEWMPRLDIEVSGSTQRVTGTVLIRNGSLPHSFPGGDPLLKQFVLTITAIDGHGKTVAEEQKRFGSSYAEVLRNPNPDPLIRGGTTRRIPFTLAVQAGARPARIQAVLSSALLPEADPTLLERYLTSLPSDHERAEAKRLLTEYTLPTLLTFRSRALEGKEMMP
ncbi:multiheme c-type cytochrome [Nitrospira moscoviensis]|uniref:Uncharacterized protein n=1 Tax=Nitrospira moscoviensis TaxID=42253 RepID=A0A0K2GIA4_NITMO|nr:multiheme c-type cytochrome [Nitrospira moscoviensis]ALA60589.1 conserved exported protein of unknown function [Nitrospira moscoviensis]